MQEIKKTRIVLASILKPVDDTRMFEKMGMSLLSLAHTEIHIIGFPSVLHAHSTGEDITLHPLPKFNRLSIQRMLMPWKVARKVLALKPSLFIITTHELLPAALLVKVLTGCRLIYDVRENYFLNILHTPAFPKQLRPLLAASVRIMEFFTSPGIDHFFLAEKAYANEINFPGKRRTILENKLKLPAALPGRNRQQGSLALLFSGTLAESTGVFVAVRLASSLYQVNSSVSLTIIGYAAQQSVLKRLKEEIKDKSFIRLIGGDVLVPHTAILEAIQSHHAGIIAYTPGPATVSSIPTKLYEYLGLQLPILLINYAPWVTLCEPYHAAIPFDAGAIQPEVILKALLHTDFYTTVPENVLWESEEKVFLDVVKTLL